MKHRWAEGGSLFCHLPQRSHFRMVKDAVEVSVHKKDAELLASVGGERMCCNALMSFPHKV